MCTDDASAIQRSESIAPGVNIIDPATATLRGAPVSGVQSVDLILEKKLSELKGHSDRLR
jgi:hypothetical protein